MAELIGYNYRITGLLFDVPLNDDQPPYGGSVRAYRDPFTTHFKILRMEQAQ